MVTWLAARRTALATTVVILIAGASAAAHDFWIEPSAFRPAVGALVPVRLRVGQDLLGDPVSRDPALLERFVLATAAAGEKLVPGRDGEDPAGVFRVDAAGLIIVGYQSRASKIELPPEKFDQYLGEEGLDAIKAMRLSRSAGSAREQFSRCAKSLVSAGTPVESDRDRALGFTLELLAERNPYATAVGQEFPVRLLYQGKPHAGALVVAINRLDPAAKLSARTDSLGRVVFRFPAGGEWLVKAVHMIPARAGSSVDWESFWASLTFEIPASPSVAGGSR